MEDLRGQKNFDWKPPLAFLLIIWRKNKSKNIGFSIINWMNPHGIMNDWERNLKNCEILIFENWKSNLKNCFPIWIRTNYPTISHCQAETNQTSDKLRSLYQANKKNSLKKQLQKSKKRIYSKPWWHIETKTATGTLYFALLNNGRRQINKSESDSRKDCKRIHQKESLFMKGCCKFSTPLWLFSGGGDYTEFCHIDQARTKANWFDWLNERNETNSLNSTAWRLMISCQEIVKAVALQSRSNCWRRMHRIWNELFRLRTVANVETGQFIVQADSSWRK